MDNINYIIHYKYDGSGFDLGMIVKQHPLFEKYYDGWEVTMNIKTKQIESKRLYFYDIPKQHIRIMMSHLEKVRKTHGDNGLQIYVGKQGNKVFD